VALHGTLSAIGSTQCESLRIGIQVHFNDEHELRPFLCNNGMTFADSYDTSSVKLTAIAGAANLEAITPSSSHSKQVIVWQAIIPAHLYTR
jgi:hypothetical protein